VGRRVLLSIVRVVGWPVLRLLEGVARFVARHGGPMDVDPWKPTRVALPPPITHIGLPSMEALRRYRSGESGVAVSSLDDVLDFLLGCRHEPTSAFRAEAADWGGLPFVFEYTRRGDCLDHSLWAWRKLTELGYDAELVVGWQRKTLEAVMGKPDTPRHAWVLLWMRGERMLLEPVAREREEMLRPVSAVAYEDYLPQYGIDARGRTFLFEGAVLPLYAELGGVVRLTRRVDAG